MSKDLGLLGRTGNFMLQRLGNGVKTRGSAVAGRIMLVGEIPVFWSIGDPFFSFEFYDTQYLYITQANMQS